MLTAPSSQQKDYEPAPIGNHIARCYKVIHVGTVMDTYMGEEKEMNKIFITFELPNELRQFKAGEAEKPWAVSREYTFSMGEKANLRKLVEGILGLSLTDEEAAGFNIEDLLGRSCLLDVRHKRGVSSGKLYAHIQGASPLPKGMEAPPQVNPKVLLDYGDNWKEEVFLEQPEYLRTKMEESKEYKAKYNIKADAPDPDEIPF